MQKMYTLDKKLLTNVPEVRIGDSVFPVDNRKSTVKKLLKELHKIESDDESAIDSDELIIKAALGTKAQEVLDMDMPFAAQTELSGILMSAMTGEEYKKEDRFPEKEAQSD